MPLPMSKVFIAVFATAAVIFLERAFPFILFSKKNPPAIIRFIEKFIPPMVMAALLFYCLKDVSFNQGVVNIVPYIAGVVITIGLHTWKRNSLISIFTGTIVYMILIRIL